MTPFASFSLLCDAKVLLTSSLWLKSASSHFFADLERENKSLKLFPDFFLSGVALCCCCCCCCCFCCCCCCCTGSSTTTTFSTTTSSISFFDFFRLKMDVMADSIVKGGFRHFAGLKISGIEFLRILRRCRVFDPIFVDFGRSSFALVPSSDSPASAPDDAPD